MVRLWLLLGLHAVAVVSQNNEWFRRFPDQKVLGWVSPFDPNRFTSEVKECHAECGDGYFDCVIYACDDNEDIRAMTYFDSFPSQSVSIWTRLLRFFSFGFLGNTAVESEEVFDLDLYMEKGSNRHSSSISFKCYQGCKRGFRKCHKDCICERVAFNDTMGLKMCTQNDVSMTTPSTILSTILFRPQEIIETTYSFNWKRIQ